VVREALETNVVGAGQTTRAFLPLPRRSARPRVVTVSSEGGSLASMGGGIPAYHVSTAALNALTRTLAGDLVMGVLGAPTRCAVSPGVDLIPDSRVG
jgi:NAD(P)-dependent dehydrogenase (short-subunit alcohol dehydrogenase family)